MLATRISFMNEIADICESVGADVESVRVGIGSDSRIGYSFIYAGCGYGGSCFPKDVKALIHMAGMAQRPSRLLEAVEARNESQKHVLAQKILSKFGTDLTGKTIGVWGLAFKPGTDDMREAPSLVLIRDVVRAGGKVKAYDPVAAATARERIPEKWLAEGQVQIVSHQYEAVEDADAMALVTEWKPFRQPDFRAMKRLMRGTAIFDGRNQYDPLQVRRHGFEYYGIGRAAVQS
jgi:UDPglucose 6-dehydrogenase